MHKDFKRSHVSVTGWVIMMLKFDKNQNQDGGKPSRTLVLNNDPPIVDTRDTSVS